MFTIVISEKGGAERRETFEGNEISVGRVQGNDLMLPKGNVSKHHARLLYRDSRFIVTDLRSTNGTYVNGRKISQATIVREGDKIYVGDFVLRVEAGQGAPAPESPRENSAVSRAPKADLAPAAVVADAAPSQPALAAAAGAPPAVLGGQRLPDPPNLSHYPLERDPDSESAPELRGVPIPPLPGPPRLPRAVELRPRASVPSSPDRTQGPPRGSPAHPPPTAAPGRSGAAAARPPIREAPHQAARRLALIALVDRIRDAIGLGHGVETAELTDDKLELIDRTARDQAKAMRAEGEAPEGIDVELLARDAVRELVGLGPLGALLLDDLAVEIHVARPDWVVVTRNGQQALAEPGFTSEEAVLSVLSRLVEQTGEPLRSGEPIVERRLERGARLVAVGPPLAEGWMLTIRKPRRLESSLEELQRSGATSRSMGVFLEACVSARANVLVVGPGAAVVLPVLAALVAATPSGERIAVVQDVDEVRGPPGQVLSLWLPDSRNEPRTLSAALKLGGDRIAVASLGGPLAAAALQAISEGAEGVLAGLAAPSLRQGLARLVAQVALTSPGASIDAAREGLSESFDVAIEVGRAPADGRLRVLRIAEIAGVDAKGIATRDLFLSNADAVGEPSFVVTGATPLLVKDFAARGVRLDAGLFKRMK